MKFLSLKRLSFLTFFIFCFVTICSYKMIGSKLFIKNVQASKSPRSHYNIVVRYSDDANAENIARKFSGKILELNSSHRIFKMELNSTASSITHSIAQINKTNGVEFSQPDYTYKTSETKFPNDPYYNKQWGLQAVNAAKAWKLDKTTKKVTVAVIDTGVSKNHPDLKGLVIPGYNFVNHKTDTTDDNGHGTHVAGIIAASINNKKGIAGIANDVKILPVKILNSAGMGDSLTIAEGIFWAADHGAKVISMSLGSSQYDKVLESAVNYAHSKGIVIIAAAGNKSGYVQASPLKVYPASLPNVIGVGAINKSLTKAYFSYIGDYVDICAPGENIYSTYLKNGYEYMSGTSMATPFVSGLAAMIVGKYPKLTPEDVERVLEETSTDLGEEGRDDSYGYGLINAEKALSGIYLNSVTLKNSASMVSLKYGISDKAYISVKIYDNNNKLVKTLVNKKLETQGTHPIEWNKKDSLNQQIENGDYNFVITVSNAKGNVLDTVNKSISIN